MNLVDRAKNVLFSPASEWETIKSETVTNNELFTKYAVILAAIPAIAGLIGYSVFGISFGFGRITLGFGTTLVWAILTYVLSLVSVYVLGWIIDILAPSFGSTKDLNASLKVAVFSYTAAWVGGIFHILDTSFLAALTSIYSLVLLYMGLKRVKAVPEDKMLGYFVVIIVVAIVLYFIIGAIVAGVAFGGIMMSSGI